MVRRAALDSALRCHDSPNPNENREPALLVHGTTQTGAEAWDWSHVPALNDEGADDETPGDVDYSTVYSATDDVVFPQLPESQSVSRQGGGAWSSTTG